MEVLQLKNRLELSDAKVNEFWQVLLHADAI